MVMDRFIPDPNSSDEPYARMSYRDRDGIVATIRPVARQVGEDGVQNFDGEGEEVWATGCGSVDEGKREWREMPEHQWEYWNKQIMCRAEVVFVCTQSCGACGIHKEADDIHRRDASGCGKRMPPKSTGVLPDTGIIHRLCCLFTVPLDCHSPHAPRLRWRTPTLRGPCSRSRPHRRWWKPTGNGTSFALTQQTLELLFDPKASQQLASLGGVDGLCASVDVDLGRGVGWQGSSASPLAETRESTAPTARPVAAGGDARRRDEGVRTADKRALRSRVFGSNAIPQARPKSLWAVMWARAHDKFLALKSVLLVVVIEPWDVPAADGVLVSGSNVRCDESATTGEAEAVRKTVPKGPAWDHRPGHNMEETGTSAPWQAPGDPFILSGSKVVEGTGRSVVCAVGESSGFGRTLMSLSLLPFERK
ncbi:hypothetical protein M427DRAFT_47393 [Gonapodya prolifera JEL478]|uniref:P-type ATPase A domain-containing protein n=1 Tax=Gonapodya prolifera (strain JEL478) TaxID=1344416 RepID=A0A139A3B2_GONPJ|nr:hypothetical protein M427DRAFT_47393 [Gonapodya prolifera JEL478]|eukprot:KXS11204.1 hypothetical protein M427DRAFT_47393 [Gonapodya prolifera JEL478]